MSFPAPVYLERTSARRCAPARRRARRESMVGEMAVTTLPTRLCSFGRRRPRPALSQLSRKARPGHVVSDLPSGAACAQAQRPTEAASLAVPADAELAGTGEIDDRVAIDSIARPVSGHLPHRMHIGLKRMHWPPDSTACAACVCARRHRPCGRPTAGDLIRPAQGAHNFHAEGVTWLPLATFLRSLDLYAVLGIRSGQAGMCEKHDVATTRRQSSKASASWLAGSTGASLVLGSHHPCAIQTTRGRAGLCST